MSSADAGEIFIGKIITEQVQANDLAENKGSDIKNQLEKDDGGCSTDTVHEVNEMDIYNLPELRPSDEQLSDPP